MRVKSFEQGRIDKVFMEWQSVLPAVVYFQTISTDNPYFHIRDETGLRWAAGCQDLHLW